MVHSSHPVNRDVLSFEMLKRLVTGFNRSMESLVDSIRLRLIGPNLLGDIQHVPLRCRIEDAIAAYGEPYERTANDDLPDTERYSFDIQNLHLVEIWVWKSVVHQVLYTSPHGDSALDLQTVFDAYGGGNEWVTWTKGYRYGTADGTVRVWCSAMPLIGVGTKEFVQFRESLETDDDDSVN